MDKTILLKRSAERDKLIPADNIEHGEIAINYNAISPVLQIKDSNDNIRQINLRKVECLQTKVNDICELNADKVNNHYVDADVPGNAEFTDTTYEAGSNITITKNEKGGNVISATDTIYTAGNNIQINDNNIISATNTTYGVMDKQTLGLGKTATDTIQTVEANSPTNVTGRTYPVQKNAINQLVVNVPWTDTDTNTVYTAGANIQINGTTISATDTKYGIMTDTTAGLGKIGYGEYSDPATLAKNFAVNKDVDGRLFVHMPSVATSGDSGLMSVADKVKLNSIARNAAVSKVNNKSGDVTLYANDIQLNNGDSITIGGKIGNFESRINSIDDWINKNISSIMVFSTNSYGTAVSQGKYQGSLDYDLTFSYNLYDMDNTSNTNFLNHLYTGDIYNQHDIFTTISNMVIGLDLTGLGSLNYTLIYPSAITFTRVNNTGWGIKNFRVMTSTNGNDTILNLVIDINCADGSFTMTCDTVTIPKPYTYTLPEWVNPVIYLDDNATSESGTTEPVYLSSVFVPERSTMSDVNKWLTEAYQAKGHLYLCNLVLLLNNGTYVYRLVNYGRTIVNNKAQINVTFEKYGDYSGKVYTFYFEQITGSNWGLVIPDEY